MALDDSLRWILIAHFTVIARNDCTVGTSLPTYGDRYLICCQRARNRFQSANGIYEKSIHRKRKQKHIRKKGKIEARLKSVSQKSPYVMAFALDM